MDKLIVAGIVAHSNWGFGLPDVEDVRHARKRNKFMLRPSDVVNDLFRTRMETPEHHQMYMDETQSWLKRISVLSEEATTAQYADAVALYNEAAP